MVPLLADLFFYTLMRQASIKNSDTKLAQSFNSAFRYIVDLLLLNNSQFGDYLQNTTQNMTDQETRTTLNSGVNTDVLEE
jgi:hypothetical protein